MPEEWPIAVQIILALAAFLLFLVWLHYWISMLGRRR